MATTFSIHYDNRGRLGQAVNFNPDNDRTGLWLEGSDTAGGESGGIFTNGNVTCIWSPGDNDLLRVLDEDGFPTGTPVFRIANDGRIFHRNALIHADYVFDPGYALESIQEHADFMRRERHLRAVPKAGSPTEGGEDVVEYGSLFRGLLEELEKAHLYIAQLNGQIEEQQASLAALSAKVEALSAS
jgi:hypothetical protein